MLSCSSSALTLGRRSIVRSERSWRAYRCSASAEGMLLVFWLINARSKIEFSIGGQDARRPTCEVHRLDG
jgi:hypothetical protein